MHVQSPVHRAAKALPPPPSTGVAALVQALRDPACYPHPVDRVEVLETHISYVVLAGDYAYKLKKPVRLPFLDFSTRQAREAFCREELRVNRRTAPRVYLDVVPIGGPPAHPQVGLSRPLLEHAVRMRRFPQRALLERIAAEGRLRLQHVEALAVAVAALHRAIAGEPVPEGLGTAAAVRAAAEEDFAEIAALEPPAAGRARLARLQLWTLAEGAALEGRFDARRREGFVRECHGDLHLGNVFMADEEAVLFDAIEFSARLRWTDVMADVAFAFMDIARRCEPLAWRFLDRYLQDTGDYAGLGVLRYFCVYRAMVRAKIACVRAGQLPRGSAQRDAAEAELLAYLALAERLAQRAAPVLVAMHGASGSGKTTVAGHLLEALGAVRLRSDVERKRMHGLEAGARTGAALAGGIYSATSGRHTYERLAALAREALAAGYAVIVDAAFLERARREELREAARVCAASFEILSCTAATPVLRRRVAKRARAGADASEAGLAVLGMQLAGEHELAPEERAHATIVDTGTTQWRAAVDALARRLGARRH